MIFNGKRHDYLFNKENKQKFITLLDKHDIHHGCETNHARADADLLIAQTAIAISEGTGKSTAVVADDTVVLALLCFHSKLTSTNLYLRPEPCYGVKKRSQDVGI